MNEPCGKCPWTVKGGPALSDSVRESAIAGDWFCCHTRMGTCYGAQRYGDAARKKGLKTHTWTGPRPPIRWVHCSVCGVLKNVGKPNGLCRGPVKIGPRAEGPAS